MYMILKTTLQFHGPEDVIPNAVGVLRLAYAPVNTLVQLIHLASTKASLPGASLQSCTFTGPELLGLVPLDQLALQPDKERVLFAKGFVVTPLPQEILEKVCPMDTQSIQVTADGGLYWQGTVRLHLYQVRGARLAEWQALQEEILHQEMTEARKRPLSWQEARSMVMHAGSEGVHIAMWVDDDNIQEIRHAIRVTLSDGACQLPHVQKAQLEATLKQAVADG